VTRPESGHLLELMNPASDISKPKSHCRVVAPYQSAFPNPLLIRKGEILAVERRETEWSGWLWCTDSEGLGGWVPETYVECNGSTCRALRDYDATELTVYAGDELEILEEAGGWLWCVTDRGEKGWVLGENVERLPASPRPSASGQTAK
jgi:hypothetical protein